MKKLILFVALVLIAGTNGGFAQKGTTPGIYPIPSFNVPLAIGNSIFKETLTHAFPTREKRDMDVVISTSSATFVQVWATVYIVKKNESKILGPYTVYPDELLSVPIDNGHWSVLISSEFVINASVWID